MSKRSNSNRDGVVAVGEVDGKTIQVVEDGVAPGLFFQWRVIDESGKVHWPHNLYDTIEEAFDAAVMYLLPDAEPVQVDEPTKEDYSALNAALYVGGAMEDIKDLGAAVGTFMAMGNGLESLKSTREAIAYDLESIEDVLASAPGTEPEHIANLNKIAEILQAQSQVLELILERSREIIHAFVSEFVRK